MKSWYVIRTKPRMELWARSNLWQRGFEVYLPQYLKLIRHARRRELLPRPLFPGYLFVESDLKAGERCAVSTAPGVNCLVSFGGYMPAVANEVISEIRAREGADGLVRLEAEGYIRGERLTVCGGPLTDLVGLFEEMGDDRRIVLLLNLLGRMTRVRVPSENVTRDS